MEPTLTSLATGVILGPGGGAAAPNRGVRPSDHHDRDEDIEPKSVAPDYSSRTVMRAGRELIGRPSRERTTDSVESGLKQALEEGQRGAPARLEQSCDPPRPSLVKHLDVAYALKEPRTRAVLHGFMCNSMPLEFIESCALALATQKDYDWFDRDWLILHKRILTNPTSHRWKFLVYITYWARKHGNPDQIHRIRTTVEAFIRSQAPASIPLFPDLEAGDEHDAALRVRCETILSALS